MSLLIWFSIAFQCHCRRTKPPFQRLLNKYFVPSSNGCREASQSLLCCSVSQGVYCRIRGLVIRNASTPRFHPKPLSLSKTPLSSNFHFRCSRPHLNTFTQHNTTQHNTTQHNTTQHNTSNLQVSYFRQHVIFRKQEILPDLL
jgi:hypothetical protein